MTSIATIYYSLKVIKSNESYQRIANQESHADPNMLIDFDMLLMSVIPHKYFINFL